MREKNFHCEFESLPEPNEAISRLIYPRDAETVNKKISHKEFLVLHPNFTIKIRNHKDIKIIFVFLISKHTALVMSFMLGWKHNCNYYMFYM